VTAGGDAFRELRDADQTLAGAAQHEYASIYAAVPESRDKRFVEAVATRVLEPT
jgi:hypothetical protein